MEDSNHIKDKAMEKISEIEDDIDENDFLSC